MAHSAATAASFTRGEAIRKEKVTPNGIPASTNPMKIGTAEHEQKGVKAPIKEAKKMILQSFFACEYLSRFFGSDIRPHVGDYNNHYNEQD